MPSFGSGWIEFARNVLLFAPLGLLIGIVAAFLVSVFAELAQFVIPHRVPASRDVIANVAGPPLGVAIA